MLAARQLFIVCENIPPKLMKDFRVLITSVSINRYTKKVVFVLIEFCDHLLVLDEVFRSVDLATEHSIVTRDVKMLRPKPAPKISDISLPKLAPTQRIGTFWGRTTTIEWLLSSTRVCCCLFSGAVIEHAVMRVLSAKFSRI